MANKTHLKIITPNGLFFDQDIDIVTVKTSEGNIGLQHGKSPFVASLKISEMHIGGSINKIAAIAGGLIYVTPTNINVITDAIEYKEKIDLNRAEKKKSEAEHKIKKEIDKANLLKLEFSLAKALNRIQVGKH